MQARHPSRFSTGTFSRVRICLVLHVQAFHYRDVFNRSWFRHPESAQRAAGLKRVVIDWPWCGRPNTQLDKGALGIVGRGFKTVTGSFWLKAGSHNAPADENRHEVVIQWRPENQIWISPRASRSSFVVLFRIICFTLPRPRYDKNRPGPVACYALICKRRQPWGGQPIFGVINLTDIRVIAVIRC